MPASTIISPITIPNAVLKSFVPPDAASALSPRDEPVHHLVKRRARREREHADRHEDSRGGFFDPCHYLRVDAAERRGDEPAKEVGANKARGGKVCADHQNAAEGARRKTPSLNAEPKRKAQADYHREYQQEDRAGLRRLRFGGDPRPQSVERHGYAERDPEAPVTERVIFDIPERGSRWIRSRMPFVAARPDISIITTLAVISPT